mmetsp:Transcript_50437/g.128268  ORF Transcript_50437/g.128268 Transcript_50437/m.128268 type:complete len:327 (+) Transcript_50437:199-1179(+)
MEAPSGLFLCLPMTPKTISHASLDEDVQVVRRHHLDRRKLSLNGMSLRTVLLQLVSMFLSIALLLQLQTPHIPGVAPVQKRVRQKADNPRDADRCSHGFSQRLRGSKVHALVFLLPELVAEDPGQVPHNYGPHCIGDGVLEGALPSHDPAAGTGRHDVREDREVRARLCPGAQQPEGKVQGQVRAKATLARRHTQEHQVDQWDAHGNAQLRAEGPAMQLEASHQTIRDQPAEQVADGRRDGADAGQDRHMPVLDARQLEEQRHVAHDTPRDGAEDALHDHDAKGGHPEELQQTFHLGDHGLATFLLALGGLYCSLVPGRLHHEDRH